MPLSPDVSVSGVDAVQRKIDRLGNRLGTAGNSTVRQVVQRVVLRIQAAMMVYPPQLPGSKYVRTGTLGRRWTNKVQTESGEIVGRVGNNTTYGPRVQSEMFQADIHKGRWQTDRQVVEREQPAIKREFEAMAQDVVREFNA